MSKMKSDSVCRHDFFFSKKTLSLAFCKKCGVISFEKRETFKSEKLSFPCDSDQLDLLQDMILSAKAAVDYNNESNVDYLSRRDFLVKFMRDLMDRFQFRQCVYYLAVDFLDFIMLSNPSFNFEIATYACFLLASKFYECDPKLPSCRNIASILNPSEEYFEERDIKKAEIICLKMLEYNLKRTTAYDFLEFFLMNGIVFEDEMEKDMEVINEQVQLAWEVLAFLTEDNRSLDFTPMQIGCAIVAFVRDQFKFKESWPKRFAEIYNIRLEDFMNCYFILKTLYTKEKTQVQKLDDMTHFNHNSNHTDFVDLQNYDQQFHFQLSPCNNQLYLNDCNSYPGNYSFKHTNISAANNYYNSDYELNSSLDETCHSYSAKNKFFSNSSHHQTKYMFNFSNSKNINCNNSSYSNPYYFNQYNYINGNQVNTSNNCINGNGNQNHSLENINCNISPFNNFYTNESQSFLYKNRCVNNKRQNKKFATHILYNHYPNNVDFNSQLDAHLNNQPIINFNNNNKSNLVNNYMFQ